MFRSILPLLRVQVDAPWNGTLTATDSSPWGFGVCERSLDPAVCARVGRVCEKWRFEFEDAIHARKHALGAADEPGPDADHDQDLTETLGELQDFPEIPKGLLDFKDWSVVRSQA